VRVRVCPARGMLSLMLDVDVFFFWYSWAEGVMLVCGFTPPLHCQSPKSSPLLALLAKSSWPIICITVRPSNFMIAVTPIEWPATFVASCVHKKKFKLRNVLDVSNDKNVSQTVAPTTNHPSSHSHSNGRSCCRS
jgi:hypothetical protein